MTVYVDDLREWNGRTRACSSCHDVLPLTSDYFYSNRSRKDGLGYECKTCARAARKDYYRRHPVESRQAALQWHRDNRDLSLEKSARYHREHKEEIAARKARERKLPGKQEEYTARQSAYRARKAGSEGSHTAEDVADLLVEQAGLCFWCDVEVGDNYHVDHVIPLVMGGSDGKENLVIACPSCNLRKGAKDPSDFAELVWT